MFKVFNRWYLFEKLLYTFLEKTVSVRKSIIIIMIIRLFLFVSELNISVNGMWIQNTHPLRVKDASECKILNMCKYSIYGRNLKWKCNLISVWNSLPDRKVDIQRRLCVALLLRGNEGHLAVPPIHREMCESLMMMMQLKH